MAGRELLAKSTFKGLRRQAVAGQYASDTWHQIVGHLSARGMDDEADLFAEPIIGRNGDVSWYANGVGVPVASKDLDDEARTEFDATFAKLYESVEAEAKRLMESRRDEERRMGALLEAALKFPSPDDTSEHPVWSLDGKPVLMNWGCLSDVDTETAGPLQDYLLQSKAPAKIIPSTPPPPDPTPVVAPAQALLVARPTPWLTWLLWLLFALLTYFILYTLLNACGVRGLTGVRYCPAPALTQSAIDNELQSLADALELQAMRAPICDEPPEIIPAEEPPEEELDEIERRRAEAGAGSGDVTITLAWDSRTDLDLELVCPDGTVIGYQTQAACGGRLDVDRNANSNGLSTSPIENIYLNRGGQQGRFRVRVHRYPQSWNESGPTPFTVRIERDGQVEEIPGRLSQNGQRVQVYEFDYP